MSVCDQSIKKLIRATESDYLERVNCWRSTTSKEEVKLTIFICYLKKINCRPII